MASNNKICPKCGTENPQGANYCRYCGGRFNSSPEILYFKIDTDGRIGDHAKLSWETSNADKVTLNGADVTGKTSSFVWLVGDMAFTLVASKGGNSISRTIRAHIQEDQRKIQLPRVKRKINKRNLVLCGAVIIISLLVVLLMLLSFPSRKLAMNNEISLSDMEMSDVAYVVEEAPACTEVDIAKDFLLIESGILKNYGYVYGLDENYFEQTVENIKLDSYFICYSDVMQRDYETLMHQNPSLQKNDSFPVMGMRYLDALKYCNNLSEKNGYDGFYVIKGDSVFFNIHGNGYRLPTRYEYAFAARDRKDNAYNYAAGNKLSEIAWYAENSNGKVHKIATKKPNELGLYDMVGNVYKYIWPDDMTSRIKVWYVGGSYKLYSYSKYTFREYHVVGGGSYDDVGIRLVFIPKYMQCGNIQTNQWIKIRQR